MQSRARPRFSEPPKFALYLSSGFLGWLGLMRRGLASAGWVLLLTPLHWLLLSLAAWRAVYQLIVAPFVWEKTAHGLAKTSHRAARMTRALLALELLHLRLDAAQHVLLFCFVVCVLLLLFCVC